MKQMDLRAFYALSDTEKANISELSLVTISNKGRVIRLLVAPIFEIKLPKHLIHSFELHDQ